jgi:hypothetical protein
MAKRIGYLVIHVVPFAVGAVFGVFLLNFAAAVPLGDSPATTEYSCNFGMGKGQAKQSCQIPVPSGCIVANFPGSNKPWTNISKGGNTTCRFNEKETDWKSRVTGTCTQCKTAQCSARFAVMLDCSGNAPPPISQSPPKDTKP